MTEILRDEPAPGICRLTLNRPDALNALTYAMYEDIVRLLTDIRYDPSIQVVVLTGAGRAFCAGHDLRAAGEPSWIAPNLGKAQKMRAVMAKLGAITPLMRSLPQPIIAAINGVTAGAGYPLAVAADITIAARSAKFVNAFHNAGTGHEMGLSYLLPRRVGAARAAELLLTGRAVMAEEAAAIGLILKSVPDAALMDEALSMAGAIQANSPIGTSLTKQSLWLNETAPSLEAAIEMESRAIFISQSTEDTAEKRKAFVEKRRPTFTNR